MYFSKTTPCSSCPYRKDAPVGHWGAGHFADLLANDKEIIAPVYGCHKNDGHVCRGYLIDQVKRDYPNKAMLITMSKADVFGFAS